MSTNSSKSYFLLEIFLPLLIGILGVGLTIVAANYTQQIILGQAKIRFEQKTQDVDETIKRRMELYTNLLFGARSFFYGSDFVAPNEWANYVKNLEIPTRDPGASSLLYLAHVTNENREAFNKSMREESGASESAYLAAFTIHPDSTKSDFYPITYIAPSSSTSANSVGFDQGSEGVRLAAIEAARDSGNAQISGTVQALTTKANVFFMYLPLYTNKESNPDIISRRENLKGLIFASFTNDKIFPNILEDAKISNDVAISFYDGTSANEQNVLFSHPVDFKGAKTQVRTEQIEVGNRPWTIRYEANENFGIDPLQARSYVSMLVIGGVFTLLLVISTYSILSSRRRAVQLANKITEDLRLNEEKYRTIFESFQDVYYQTDAAGIITIVSPSIEKYNGLKPEQIVGKLATDFYLNPTEREAMLVKLKQDHVLNDYEITLKGIGNNPIPTSLSAKMMFSPSQEFIGVEGVLRDISDRKQTQTKLVEKTEELERMNKLMTDRELKMIELKKELEQKGLPTA